MTQLELADLLGVTEQQINKYVNDRQKMSLKTSYNVAKTLNCHIENLYEWVEAGD